MKHSIKTIVLFGGAILLSACSGTGAFVGNPKLSVTGINAPGLQPSKVVEQLFAETSVPYRINFCEADPNTKTCPDTDVKPSASGVGGFFLPLAMGLRSLEIEDIQSDNNGTLNFSAKLDAPVNKIQPFCGTVDGKVETRAPQNAKLQMSNFYCNWAVIGNVITNATFSIESIDPVSRSFTGYYKISFYGTGNANGSGYFRAQLDTKNDFN